MESGDDRDGSMALARLEADLSRVATLAYAHYGSGIVTIRATPHNDDAGSIWFSYLGDAEIVLGVGDDGGRWELDRSPADVAFFIDVVTSVMAGRVRETFGRGRSRVEVTLQDRSVAAETGYSWLLPTPGWRGRGRTIQYKPYAVDAAS